jgi:beta-glucanase (GH16 family)
MNRLDIFQLIQFRNIYFLLIFTVLSCSTSTEQNLDERNWQLEWSDEFEGPEGEPPDDANWTFDLGGGGFGNEELQVYTNTTENVSLDGEGNLVITALASGGSFTSARIKTEGLFEQAYGRFEARMKTPFGPGLWPAFWMLGADFAEVGWPQSGEIDIMELRGQQPTIIHGSAHGPGYSAGEAITKSFGLQNARFDTEFHLFAILSMIFSISALQKTKLKKQAMSGFLTSHFLCFSMLQLAELS